MECVEKNVSGVHSLISKNSLVTQQSRKIFLVAC